MFIAIVMGTVIRPAVTWLNRRGLPQIAGVILVYFLLLTLLVGFAFLLFPLVIEQGATISAAVPGYYHSLREGMTHYPNQLILRLSEFLPATLPGLEVVQQTGAQMLVFAGQAMGYVALAAKVIFMAIAILLLAFQWTLEGPQIIQSLLLLVPKGQRESSRDLIASMESKVSSYVAGQAVLCLAIGILALGCLSAHRLAQCPGAGAPGGCIGSHTDDWTAARRYPCCSNCLIHITFQVGLGDRRYDCDSASWKTVCWCRASCVRQ